MPKTLNPWVVCPQPNPNASLKLFCFHYAGGGAATFYDWSAALSADVELNIIDLPGRGKHLQATPFRQIEPLIRALKRAIRPSLDKPFAFLGHSMGAIVCFELARALSQECHPLKPEKLFVSGQGAPQIPDSAPPIHLLPEDEFIDRIRLYNGTPEEIFNNAELMDILIPRLRADFAITETYKYIPSEKFDFPICAFGGFEDYKVPIQDLEAWKAQTSSMFQLQMFPGDHFFINTSGKLLLISLKEELNSSLSILKARSPQ